MRSNLIGRLAVFPPTGGAERVLVDKLSIYIQPHGVRHVRSGLPREAAAISAAKAAGVLEPSYTRAPGVPVLCWHDVAPRVSVTQFLGLPKTGGRPTLTQVADLNPARAVADDLRVRGRLPRLLPTEPDNYIDPRRVRAEDASMAVLDLVPRYCEARVGPYLSLASRLFDLSLTRDDIAVGVKKIELAWDVECSLAGWAPRAFWSGWECVMARHSNGRPSLHSPALLKAGGAKGEAYKLYPKAGSKRCSMPGVLRFEVSLTGTAIRERLGRQLDLLDRTTFLTDVRELARQIYPLIVKVQESMSGEEMVAAHLVFAVMLPTSQKRAAQDILGALLGTGEFQNAGGSQVHRRLLVRLRKEGHVACRWKGRWIATELFHRTLRQIFRYLRDTGAELVKP